MNLPAWKIADIKAITGIAPDVEPEPEALEAPVKPVKESAVRKVTTEKAVAQ